MTSGTKRIVGISLENNYLKRKVAALESALVQRDLTIARMYRKQLDLEDTIIHLENEIRVFEEEKEEEEEKE